MTGQGGGAAMIIILEVPGLTVVPQFRHGGCSLCILINFNYSLQFDSCGAIAAWQLWCTCGGMAAALLQPRISLRNAKVA